MASGLPASLQALRDADASGEGSSPATGAAGSVGDGAVVGTTMPVPPSGPHALHVEEPMPLDITGGAGMPPAASLPAPIDAIQLMTSTRRGLGAAALASGGAQASAATGISTGTGGQGVGFAMPPVIPWSQQSAVQFIQALSPGAAAAAAATTAGGADGGAVVGAGAAAGGEEAVEGGPEAPVPSSPAVAGTSAGGAPGGATAPSVTALPPSASAAVGEGPLPREKGVWLGAGNPLSRLLHRKRPTHAAGRGGLPLGAERVPVARGYDVDEHKLSLPELAAKYKVELDLRDPVRSRGLTAEDARARLREHGPNQLTPPKELPAILQFAKQFGNLLMIM